MRVCDLRTDHCLKMAQNKALLMMMTMNGALRMGTGTAILTTEPGMTGTMAGDMAGTMNRIKLNDLKNRNASI